LDILLAYWEKLNVKLESPDAASKPKVIKGVKVMVPKLGFD